MTAGFCFVSIAFMLAVKLQRIGKKHQPSYRLIVQEKREKLGGRYAEDLGWYNPLDKKHEFKKERVEYWLKVGAKPTPTVHNLLIKTGIISGSKMPVHKTAKKTEEVKPPEVKAEESKTLRPEAIPVTEGETEKARREPAA